MTGPQAGPDRTLIKDEPGTLIWSQPLPSGGRAVVKMYRHRPFYDPARRLLNPYRVEREYELLARLRQHGMPCPEPLWWEHGRDTEHGRHELLATREIAGTTQLAQRLRDATTAAVPDLAPLFELARRMHEAGISHGAFYPTNTLVSPGSQDAPAFHLVDLAQGCRFAGNIVGTRPAEFDLLDMLHGIGRRYPLKDCGAWVAGYGLDAGGIERLLGRFARHRLERPWRHLRRAETDTRAAWDRFTRGAASPASGAVLQTPRHTPRR